MKRPSFFNDMTSAEAEEYMSYLNNCIESAQKLEFYSQYNAREIHKAAVRLSEQFKQAKVLAIPLKKVISISDKGVKISLIQLMMREEIVDRKNKTIMQRKLAPPVIHVMALKGNIIQYQGRQRFYSQIKTSSNIVLKL